MRKLFILFTFIIFIEFIDSQLIRQIDVYKHIIKEVCDYYQCFSITLFYGKLNSTQLQDINIITSLKKLSMHFKSKLLIQTTVTDIKSFISQLSETKFNLMVQPLFVLMDDSDNTKLHFTTLLAPFANIFRSIWLSFMKDKTSVDHFFENVYIPFDCKFMVSKENPSARNSEIIIEIYRLNHSEKLQKSNFAIWNIKTGMGFPATSFNQRRSNLHGHNLRVTTINYPPATIVKKNNRGEIVEIEGFCGRIMDELQHKLNFTATYQMASSVGRPRRNGSWTGGLGALIDKTTDIFITNTQIIDDQPQKLDYTTPLYRAEYRFYIKKTPIISMYWDGFLKPFPTVIWLLIGCFVLIGSFIILFIKFLKRKGFMGELDQDQSPSSIPYTLLTVFGALCFQGMPRSSLISVQIVQFTIHITVVIIFAAYSAKLISSLTLHLSDISIKTTENLLNDKSYVLGMVNGSSDYFLFQNTTDSLLAKVFEQTMKYETTFPANRYEGLQRTCDDEKFAFMAGHMSVAHFNSVNCTLIPLDTLFFAPMSMVLQRHSPFRRIINHQLSLMREGGTLAKMLQNLTVIDDDEEETWTAVELYDIIVLIVFIIGSYIVSFILLLGEKTFFFKKTTQKKKDIQRLVVKVMPSVK